MADKIFATCFIVFFTCVLLIKADPDPDGEFTGWKALVGLAFLASTVIGFLDLIYLIWS